MRPLRARTWASRARSRSVTSTEERLVGGRILLLKERQDGDAGGVHGNRLGLELDPARRAGRAAVGEEPPRALEAPPPELERRDDLLGRLQGGVDERDLEASPRAQAGCLQ